LNPVLREEMHLVLSFLATRQAAIAAIVVVLMLLAGLPSSLNPALAQSEPTITLDPREGAPGTGVTIQGSGWIPGETVILWFAVNLEADGSSTENTIWYDLGEAVVGDDGTFVSTFTSSSHFPSWLTGPS
jgi:hypothetical protein